MSYQKTQILKIDEITGGPVVDQNLETTLKGVFACGNCLQVYDTVDMLSLDAKRAGKNAAKYTTTQKSKDSIELVPAKGVRHIVPQKVNEAGTVHLTLRAGKPRKKSTLRVITNGKELLKKKLPWVNPANMIKVDVDISSEVVKSGQGLEVMIDD
ncbi:hypothetical protein MBGDF03_01000 [Thermoplasmatales archaeon SCGC AB-540-F20]|nr:hypothetical protein MBGDF03_01000 [Thermoplasmatales archaeon SCGC AB-540-F20]